MSSVSVGFVKEAGDRAIPLDSLLEYLYSYFSLNQLKGMLEIHPGDATLMIWGVGIEEYQTQIRIAID